MPTSVDPEVRAIDIAVAFVEREADRMREVIASEEKSSEEKLEALRDLAFLSSRVIRELVDDELPWRVSGSKAPDRSAPLTTLRMIELKPEAQSTPSTCRPSVRDNPSEGVYLVDMERRITYWNHGARNLAGFERKQAVGKHCHGQLFKTHGRRRAGSLPCRMPHGPQL